MTELVPTKRVTLKALIANFKAEEAAEIAPAKNTKAARLERAKGSGKELTYEQREQFRVDLETFADKVASVDIIEPRKLDWTEKHFLMAEYAALEEAELISKARRERIKAMVFAHVSEEVTEQGGDPTTQGGSIEVGQKKFCKEGGGTKDPEIDHMKFMDLLGDDWDEVYQKEIIPEKVVYALNEKWLDWHLQKHPEAIELLRESLIAGANKPFRFSVRSNVASEEA